MQTVNWSIKLDNSVEHFHADLVRTQLCAPLYDWQFGQLLPCQPNPHHNAGLKYYAFVFLAQTVLTHFDCGRDHLQIEHHNAPTLTIILLFIQLLALILFISVRSGTVVSHEAVEQLLPLLLLIMLHIEILPPFGLDPFTLAFCPLLMIKNTHESFGFYA